MADKFKFLRLAFCDINGVMRSTLHRTNRTSMKTAKAGADFLTGNSTLKPLLDTLRPVTWSAVSDMGQCFAEDTRDGVTSTRALALNQLQKLHHLGYSLKYGVENEFFLTDKHLHPVGAVKNYLTSLETSRHSDILVTIVQRLQEAGIDITRVNLEMAPGQFEFIRQPQFGIREADECVILQQVVKEVCQQSPHYMATFSSKPFLRHSTNAKHFNFSLWDGAEQRNLFHWQEDGELSDVLRHFVAGLMLHLPALMMLFCPSLICFRRLARKRELLNMTWGFTRTSGFNIKPSGAGEVFVESRLPSGAANTYLLLAGHIAAGIDGILHQRELTDHHYPAVDTYSMEDALAILEKNDCFREAFGASFIEEFIRTKKQQELNNPYGDVVNNDAIYEKANVYYNSAM